MFKPGAEQTAEFYAIQPITIRVTGKGGHQRVIPLNERVVEALDLASLASRRGITLPLAREILSERYQAG